MESILKTRFRTAETFLRTAMGRGSKIGMGRGKGGAMGKGKGAGNPEAKPHGEKRLRFVELLNRSSLKMQLLVCPPESWPAGGHVRWVSETYSLCLPFAFSSFVSECRLCLPALSP